MFVEWSDQIDRWYKSGQDWITPARQRAYGAALSVLRDRLRAEELAADALTDTLELRSPEDFRTPAQFRSYVAQAARRRGLDELRRRRRVRGLVQDGEIDGSAPDPGAPLESRDVAARIQASIDRLSSRSREVLRLRTEGRRLHEISRALGVAVATVWRYEVAALRELRAKLSAANVGAEDCGDELRSQLELDWSGCS